MSLLRRHRVACECGVETHALVSDSLNAERHPHLRDALLARRLHVFSCGGCGAAHVVEKPLLYFDFGRRHYIAMYPRSERPRAAVHARTVEESFRRALSDKAPPAVRALADAFHVRVCFGYESLREKLVADAAGLDDRVLEALKGAVLAASSELRKARVATLRLDSVARNGALVFSLEWLDRAPAGAHRRVRVERRIYDLIAQRGDGKPAARGAYVSLLARLHASLSDEAGGRSPARR